ncbi:unnamed protein product [Caenorhabditis auriculariae]|uniref:TIL domain-containing protein n=1 Tax=Caenorhabditis auriculariae TaxID=2777116 RepID=A0A8S1H2A3_9PELO|nr:unnamed protein product [Caenorhabditis auriculariae]
MTSSTILLQFFGLSAIFIATQALMLPPPHLTSQRPRNCRCGRNELFKECGTACEPRCGEPLNRPCTRECVPNVCQCRPGLLRSYDNSTCVRLIECNKIGTAQLTTASPVSCRSVRCASGTECQVRNRVAQCVPSRPTRAENRTCGQNEEFRACGTACEPKCGRPEPEVCTEQCILNVCQCRRGFARSSEGRCVRRSECDTTRGATAGLCNGRRCPNGQICRHNGSRSRCEAPQTN